MPSKRHRPDQTKDDRIDIVNQKLFGTEEKWTERDMASPSLSTDHSPMYCSGDHSELWNPNEIKWLGSNIKLGSTIWDLPTANGIDKKLMNNNIWSHLIRREGHIVSSPIAINACSSTYLRYISWAINPSHPLDLSTWLIIRPSHTHIF